LRRIREKRKIDLRKGFQRIGGVSLLVTGNEEAGILRFPGFESLR
jgi:hypothetical protein